MTEPTGSDPSNDRPITAELTEAMLEPALFERYFEDLAQFAEVLAILPKRSAQEYSGNTSDWSLEQAREAVRTGSIRGVQIRYRYQDDEWWDTLLCLPTGVRIVRMKQDR